MQEHPVPQNVTGYEFHLIGQMTLKQFFTCLVGVGLAILIYATNLPDIFKYPIVVLFGVGGFALAFVPLEGRSLDVWFLSFIKSVYKPTLFFWKKTNPVPEAFNYIQPRFLDLTPSVDYSGIRTERAREFMETIPGAGTRTDEIPEENVDAILALFSQPIPAKGSAPKEQSPTIPIFQRGTKEVVIKPSSEPIKVAAPTPVPVTQAPEANVQTREIMSEARGAKESVRPVETSANLPFPKPPTKPNMIVGMTFSHETPPKIIDDAIVEIINREDGTPVRALKTNAVGQFSIVTPLASGEYEINVEKEGYSFDKTLLVLNNQVVQPLLIQAKS